MKTKYCPKCKKQKSSDKFSKSKCRFDGLQSWCKSCMKKWRDKTYARTDKSRKVNKAWVIKQKKLQGKNFCKKYRIKHLYGLTLKQHKEIYIQQNGCCAICNESVPYDKIFTDHNHAVGKGKMRALLCNRCNTMLGYLEKFPELTQRMFEYMEKNEYKNFFN